MAGALAVIVVVLTVGVEVPGPLGVRDLLRRDDEDDERKHCPGSAGWPTICLYH